MWGYLYKTVSELDTILSQHNSSHSEAKPMTGTNHAEMKLIPVQFRGLIILVIIRLTVIFSLFLCTWVFGHTPWTGFKSQSSWIG